MQTIKHAFLPVLQFSMISLSVRISRLPVGSNEKNRIQLNLQNWQKKIEKKNTKQTKQSSTKNKNKSQKKWKPNRKQTESKKLGSNNKR